MTDQNTPKKPGRPRKATAQPAQVATTPQESPSPESKSEVGTQVPDEPEIDVQRVALEATLLRHMVRDHRMTYGEARITLGYGLPNQDPDRDAAWTIVFNAAK